MRLCQVRAQPTKAFFWEKQHGNKEHIEHAGPASLHFVVQQLVHGWQAHIRMTAAV